MKLKQTLSGLLALAACTSCTVLALPVFAENTNTDNAEIISQADSGWHKKNGRWYFITDNGDRLAGTKARIDGNDYFFDNDGWMITGWVLYEDNWYFAGSSGAMKTGWLHDGSAWYFTNSEGIMQTGWLEEGGKTYFLGKSGAMKTGWALINDLWYFFDDSGAMQTGWIKDKNTWYFTNDEGIMQTGWLEDNGQTYFLGSSGAMKTGWLKQNFNWYYFGSSGAMKTGWLKYKNDWYYLSQKDGAMLSECWIEPDQDGVSYYLNADGIWTDTGDGLPSELLAYNPEKIGTLEMTPCSFLDYGWLTRLNGSYGVLGSDGAWTVPAKYGSARLMTNMDSLTLKINSNDYDCVYMDSEGIQETTVGGIGGYSPLRLVVTDDGKLQVMNTADNTFSSDFKDFMQADECYFAYPLEDDLTLSEDELFYYAGGSEKLYGPYAVNSASFKYYEAESSLPNLSIFDYNVQGGAFTGLFATENTDGTWTLNTPVNDKTIDGFTRIKFSSPSSAVCWEGNSCFEVYDLNLNLLYTSDSVPGIQLQNGSAVVNGRTMVQYQNDWYLIDNPGK